MKRAHEVTAVRYSYDTARTIAAVLKVRLCDIEHLWRRRRSAGGWAPRHKLRITIRVEVVE